MAGSTGATLEAVCNITACRGRRRSRGTRIDKWGSAMARRSWHWTWQRAWFTGLPRHSEQPFGLVIWGLDNWAVVTRPPAVQASLVKSSLLTLRFRNLRARSLHIAPSLALACALALVPGCKKDCSEDSTQADCQQGDPPASYGGPQGCPPGPSYHNAGEPKPLSFEEPITHAAGSLQSLQLGDLNGDGHVDVVGSPITTSQELLEGEIEPLWIGFGDGTGAFEPRPLAWEVAVPELPGGLDADIVVAVAVVAVDLDGDGRTDLLTGGLPSEPNTPQIIWGGAEFPEERSSLGEAYSSPLLTFLLPGDFDGDGRMDVAACNARCEVAFGEGERKWTQFFRATESAWDFSLEPQQMTFDLYGTGQHMLATLEPSEFIVARTEYWQAVERDAWQRVATTTPGVAASMGTAGDLDGDRKDEFVARGTEYIQVSWNDDGEFALQNYCLEQASSRPSNPLRPRASLIGDFDGDGRRDVLVGSQRTLSSSGGLALSVLSGTDVQQLTRPARMDVPWGALSALGAADLDGDGRDDVLVAHQDPDGLSVLLSR